ncbi:targeting protein for Xklp2 homolog [Neodiprion lecontei]|uniref:Targeting protein for Xklp2 homolog n=1 Tax=Neodiprion lecontei TaxID=441921 RepID=A0A6J0CES4_NEOLC|nr:targeting protein for Xklp2 homolog [Neodiprion lecontei]
MDGVWHLNAPQWTDFASSPQPLDDGYFDLEHEELEPQPVVKQFSCTAPSAELEETKGDTKAIKRMLKVPESNDSLIQDIEVAKLTPVKVVPKLRSKKNATIKETTYDNVLTEAMASLQLSARKNARRSHTIRSTPSKLTSTPMTTELKPLIKYKAIRSTPSNPIPAWIRRVQPSEKLRKCEKNIAVPTIEPCPTIEHVKTLDNLSVQDSQQTENAIIDNNVFVVQSEKKPADIDDPLNMKHIPADSKPKATEEVPNTAEEPKDVADFPINDKVKVIKDPAIGDKKNAIKLLPTEFESQAANNLLVNDATLENALPVPGCSKRASNISQQSCFSNKGHPARFSTCQLRRQSLIKYRRRSNKYVSMAEAISKFQTGTPKRFRSISSKNAKLGPVQKVRQVSVSATVPISPALRCKSRTRPTTILSHEEREQQELQELRKYSARGNMARANSLKSLAQNPAPRTVIRNRSVSSAHPPASTSTKICKSNMEDKVNREAVRIKVTVPTVVSTKEGVAVQDAEISNFGVPDITSAKSTTTKVMPFSFEMRNKELQKKKEKKIKELMNEEQNKTKGTFHARPVPIFKKPMLAVPKETNTAKHSTKPCPFSFENRDKNLLKKKENYIKTILEEDKKARIFQAKPIPEFKPVLVRGISKENISSGNKASNSAPSLPQKTRISTLPISKTGSRNCLLTKNNCSNQENQNPSVNSNAQSSQNYKSKEDKSKYEPKPIKVLSDHEFQLNTDKRAKERKEFDERIKQKEQEIEKLKKEAEAEKLKRTESEIAELRKMAEIQARPMPIYKPPVVIRSEKPLTEPQSPGWASKPKR